MKRPYLPPQLASEAFLSQHCVYDGHCDTVTGAFTSGCEYRAETIANHPKEYFFLKAEEGGGSLGAFVSFHRK